MQGKHWLRTFLPGLLLLITQVATAQNIESDSIRDVKVDTSLNWQHEYDYLKRAERNTRSMLKLNFIQLFHDATTRLFEPLDITIPELIYERKVFRYHSFIVSELINSDKKWKVMTFQTTVAWRYWYSLKGRVESGKSPNNLSAPYIMLSGSHYIIDNGVEFKSPAVNQLNNAFLYSLSIGYQKELGKFGFVDLGAGRSISNQKIIKGYKPFFYFKLGLKI